MKAPFAVDIDHLKCDADGCGYQSEAINTSNLEQYLDLPCPKCGANLLTEQDLAATMAILALVEWGNKVVGPAPDDAEMVRLSIDMDGSGVVSLGAEVKP